MRVLFLGFTKIKYLPYMHFYLDQIDSEKNDVHLVYWDRDEAVDSEVPADVHLHCYKKAMNDSWALSKKLLPIYGFGKFAKQIIHDIKPDFLFVLHSTTAITIYSLLCKEYKAKYIFDFRDLTYERFGFYKKMVANVICNSAASFTSSDGFREFLPDTDKLYTSHNLLNETLKLHEEYFNNNCANEDRPITIAFWGMLRHLEYNIKVIEKLGNDPRFELHYYGRCDDEFRQLFEECKTKYKNIFYHGEYLPSERNEFAKNTDLIHNLYSNNDATMPHAMGNKFYDGLIYYIPLLSQRDSFMGRMCSKYQVGLECDPTEDSFADDIYNYYRTLDREQFNEHCDIALSDIMEQVKTGEEIVRGFVNG